MFSGQHEFVHSKYQPSQYHRQWNKIYRLEYIFVRIITQECGDNINTKLQNLEITTDTPLKNEFVGNEFTSNGNAPAKSGKTKLVAACDLCSGLLFK